MTSNLPDTPVNWLVQDPAFPETLYAATDVGLGRRTAETILEYRGRLAGTVRFTNGDFDTLTALAGRAAYAEDGLSAADGRRAVTLARTASRDIRRSAGRPRLILGLYRLERPSFLRPSDG